jgi:serine/threonine protein kinase/tetratricopeptide (TPR) repeat protein
MKRHPGEQLGKYRLVRLLGRGGFAEVYLGEQVYLQTYAAIKILHAQLTDEQTNLFLQEARTLAHLYHPHIVPVLDFDVQDSTSFLVLHYAPRGSIRNLHPKGTRLPLPTIISYVKQIASALQFAHEQHLIHRDVKPENLLLGHYDAILLSDFGLAVTVQSTQGPALYHIAGTLPYMAPEQLQGHPCYASDQYALGIVVYEWLSGSPPFVGSPPEIMAQQLTVSPPSLCEKLPGLPSEVEHVVFTALHKDPLQRFPSIDAFAAALEHAWQIETTRSTSVLKRVQVPVSTSPRDIHQHSLVGREQEQAWLLQCLLEVEQQLPSSEKEQLSSRPSNRMRSIRSSGALLLGEAGIGKTRLAEELSATAQSRGWAVLWSRGYAQESVFPYHVWVEIIRLAIQSGLWSPQDAQVPSHLLLALVPLLPELASLPIFTQISLLQEANQASLYIPEAIYTILMIISQHTPLLVVLDDLHWADAKSRDVLSYLLRRLSTSPFLLLGTCREDELRENNPLSTSLTNLQRERVLSTIAITALSDTAVRTLISHLPEPLIQSIQQRAAGNPFFAEELAHLFYDENREEAQKKTQTSSRKRSSLPETIRAVLDERLRRLSIPCQHLLQKASILQQSFSLMVLQLMDQGQQSSQTSRDLLKLLEEALNAGILIEEGTGVTLQYRFWHPLLVDYLYESLSMTRRTSLHLRAASVLRQIYAVRTDEGAASILYHLIAGAAPSPSIAFYAEQAAHHCYELCAYIDAERYYRIALQKNSPSENQSAPISPLLPNHYIHLAVLHECLGDCLRFQGKNSEACESFEQALKLHQQYDSLVSLHEDKRDIQIQSLLCCEIANTYYDRDMLKHSLQYCEQGEKILRFAGISTGPALAALRLHQGFIRWQEGLHTEAYRLAQEALTLFEDALQHMQADPISLTPSTRLRRTLRCDPINSVRAQMLLGHLASTIGLLQDAIARMSTSLAFFEQQGSQRDLALCCTNLGNVYLKTVDNGRAQALFERTLLLSQWMGEVPLESLTYINLGILAARAGELAEAEAQCKKGLFLAESIDEQYNICTAHAFLALFLYEQGKRDEGNISLQHAYILKQKLYNPFYAGFTATVDGQVQLSTILADSPFSYDPSTHTRPFSEKDRNQLQALQKMLQPIASLEGLDAEIRIEAHLLLAQLTFLLGDRRIALQLTQQTLAEADQISLTWASVRIRRLLGCILLTFEQRDLAHEHFSWSLLQSQTSKMPLEYARTLLEWGSLEPNATFQGKPCLQEAQSIFNKHHALLDLQCLKQILAARASPDQR